MKLISIRSKSLVTLAAAGGLAGALAFWAAAETLPLERNITREKSPPARQTGDERLLGYTEIVQKVAPSVVSIYSTKAVQSGARGQSPFGSSPSPFDFFRDEDLRRFFGPQGPSQPDRPTPRQGGAGSGVILTADGYILTNNHVVDGADEIKVALGDNGKRELEAEIVGADPQSDLAVLKVNAGNLPAATWGDSDQLLPGDTVLAIGNPFGLNQTVTLGIVSAVGRSNLNIAGYENFIQTDASINPGNSGGALIDNRGRVVGINTAIFSRSGGNIGIGFAIPVNMALRVANSLIEDGQVTRGYLGVMLGELTPDLAEALGVEERGILINDVMPDTPAADAGLEDGDVVVAYNGKRVDEMTKLRLMVGNTRPGEKVTLTLIRDGRKRDVEVTIGELDPQLLTRAGQAPPSGRSQSELFSGVSVAKLTPEMRERLGLPESTEGLLVTEVEPDSEAAEAGLRSGHVITEIDRRRVGSLREGREAVEGAGKSKMLVRVATQEGSRYLALETGD